MRAKDQAHCFEEKPADRLKHFIGLLVSELVFLQVPLEASIPERSVIDDLVRYCGLIAKSKKTANVRILKSPLTAFQRTANGRVLKSPDWVGSLLPLSG